MRLFIAALLLVWTPTVVAADLAGPPTGIRAIGPRVEVVPLDREPVAERRQRHSRGADLSIRLSPTSIVGSVNNFALTPDGSRVIYIADQDTAGLIELYSVPVDGSASPVKLSSGLTYAGGANGVALFQIGADSSTVFFLADAGAGGGSNNLYSVPVDGSSGPVQLNTAAQAPVTALGATPDGSGVIFFGTATTSGAGSAELYRATPGVASSAVQLSEVSATNPFGAVVAADFSPDGSTVIFAADAGADSVFQWHAVAYGATGPGSDQLLSSAISFVTLGQITADSQTLVYAADENTTSRVEIFSIGLDGSGKAKLNDSMVGNGVNRLVLSGDGLRVGYLADQVTADVVELFGAVVGAASSSVRLNAPLSGTQEVDSLTLAPDNMTAIYESDETTAGTFQLRAVPLDGSSAPQTLDAVVAPANAGSFAGFGTPVRGGSVVYPLIDTATDLYSVPVDGATTPQRINDLLPAGDTVLGAFLPAAEQLLLAYGVGDGMGVALERLYVASARANLPVEQANVSAAPGSLGLVNFGIASDERYVVYVQDQTTAGKPELFAWPLDSDGDTIINAADNCPLISNIGQDAVIFDQSLTASDKETFGWTSAADVRFVRGPLSQVSALVTDQSGVLQGATAIIDAATPPVGDGYYYLVAPDCDGRSYQTVLGAEPGRDSASLP